MASGVFYPAASADDGYCQGAIFQNALNDIVPGSGITGFVRFANINIPKGAIITKAYVRVKCSFAQSNNVYWDVDLNDADDPDAPTSCAELNGLSMTGETYLWDVSGAWLLDVSYEPDSTAALVDAVQTIVNRDGWASGNHMIVKFTDNGSDGGQRKYFYAYDNGSGYAELHVEWAALTPIQKAFELLWNIGLFSVERDWITINHLTTQIVKNFTLNWALLIASEIEMPYDIHGEVENDFLLRYDITSQIIKDWTLKWAIQVSADWEIPYALRHEVLRSWEIIIPIQMNVDWSIPNSITGMLTKDWTLRNDIEAKIQEAFVVKYGIEVSKDIQVVNSIRHAVDAVFVMKNHITGATQADTEIKFNILDKDPVSVDFELRNSILGKPVIYKITFTD